MSSNETQRSRGVDMFLEVGIWLLFFALLVPAGFVGYEIGRSARDAGPGQVATAAVGHRSHR